MKGLRLIVLWLAVAGVAGLGTAALLAADRHPDQSLGGAAAPALALQLLAGLAAACAGAHLARQRSARIAGTLLLVTGVAVFLEQLPLPQSGGALLFTAALVGGATTSALAGAAALAAAATRRRLIDTVAACAAVACSALVLGLLPATTFDPRVTGCFACARNLLLIHGDARVHDALVRAGLIASAVSCAALALLVVLRVILRPALLRSIAAPLLICAAVATLGSLRFLHDSQPGQPEVDSTTRALWLAQCAILTAAAAGVALQALRARRLRQRVATTVLSALPSPEQLRATLAKTLRDPGLEVVFPRVGGGAIDANGHRVPDAGSDVAITEVARRGEVVAELRHATKLAETPGRVAQAALGAGLALEHASLHAKLRAELADLTASRVRIVEVGEAERRRLERNLHDGAQQRLIALSLALQLMPDEDPEIQRARAVLQDALENLRGVAHRIHPVSLTEAGLAPALRELGEGSRVPVRIQATTAQRPPASAEAALYRLVLDCVRLAERDGNGHTVDVRVETESDAVRARIHVPGIDAPAAALALQHAADRLVVASGELRTIAAGADVIIEASAPCGS
jgi:signal transduction histidine kinase